MSNAAFMVGGVLPYMAIVVFLIGVVIRLVGWKRVPQPGLITLYPTKGAGFKDSPRRRCSSRAFFGGTRPCGFWLGLST